MQRKRVEWRQTVSVIPSEKLVFLDESGVNTDLVRGYGRSVGKTRVVDHAPVNTPTNTTVLSAIRLDGQFACVTYTGGTTKDRFMDYLKQTLLPALREGDCVVMDNMRSHHAHGVEELIRSAGAIPLYLPPYSPDFNPIEKMWSKMKSILRKWRIRTAAHIPQAVIDALSQVSVVDCRGWFSCVGF